MKQEKFNYINFNKSELDRLFLSAKNDDHKSFDKLSGYIRQISFSYFQSKLRLGKIINNEDAEDLANNVYLSFAEQYKNVENIEFWLRRVLYLTFINFYKKSRANKSFELDEAFYLEDTKYNPGDVIDAQTILKVINTLSDDKQSILKMRFWEDLKFSEISERIAKSEDAVKKMFYRTIEEIKKKL